MSELEAEISSCSSSTNAEEQEENQESVSLDYTDKMLHSVKETYDAIQIPGELNTRVRAVIESNKNADSRKKKEKSIEDF